MKGQVDIMNSKKCSIPRLFFRKVSKYKNGVSIIMMTLSLTMITAVAAVTVDVGSLAAEKSRLSMAVDAAALAGARELVFNPQYAESRALDYLSRNDNTIENQSIEIDLNEKTITVNGEKTVIFTFAKIFGMNDGLIRNSATARVANISSITGMRPLAVIQQTFVYGQLYTLKEDSGDGLSGNYAGIALGGGGAAKYKDNLLNGYPGKISVGDLIETETGVIALPTEQAIETLIAQCDHYPACTWQQYVKSCPRIIFVPVVNTLDVNGKKYVQVLGFGTFFLEGVVRKTGNAEVLGRFVTYTMEGETENDIGDFGTYGIKLIR